VLARDSSLSIRDDLMALTAGTRLGSYVIQAPLGAGGMGEVYRARDTTLRRDVAVKILHERFARDHDRLARFTREAQTLAALNHPNIAHIHGVEDSAGVRALVMELVEGEALSQRVRRGPVHLDEALPIARQIAEALEAAHAQGIVHRDLKPANVMVRADGTVKVLDFGLAKALARDGAGSTSGEAARAAAPTMTSPAPMTEVGVIAGTPAYMSPEQAKGRPVDKGSDIWAFGCVLFEMLTGTRAFEGDDALDTMAKVVKLEPPWERLPPTTPPAVRLLLQRCLRKDPRHRLQDAAGVRIEIEDALSAPAGSALASSAPAVTQGGPLTRWRLALAAGAALLAGAVIAGLIVWHLKAPPPAASQIVGRLTVPLPPDQEINPNFPALAVSPDGTHVVYVAGQRGVLRLHLRPVGNFEGQTLLGTDGALAPFFSPDGQWVGFFADGLLKKVPITGGGAQTVCQAPNAYGGSWASNGIIYFSPSSFSGLWQVSAQGGTPQPFSKLENGEISHRWPQVLPGGKAVLFTSRTGPGFGERQVQLQHMSGAERRVLAQGDTGLYVSSGHLVYLQTAKGTLLAVPFDLARLQVASASPVVVATGILEGGEGAQYSVSNNGLLAYLAGRSNFEVDRGLVWVDRKGNIEPLNVSTRPYQAPRVSPDGQRVTFQTLGAMADVWVHTLARGEATKLISEGSNQYPLWTPDGQKLAYRGTRAGSRNVFWRVADGSGVEAQLTTGEGNHVPTSWSPDGNVLLFSDGKGDLWFQSIADRSPRPFVRTRFLETDAQFSPDGRWVVYVSEESGRAEIYVQPYPGAGAKSQISTDGGTEPTWNPNGRELFYRNGKQLMAVEVTTQGTFAAGRPTRLFTGDYEQASGPVHNYDVSRDGRRFLMVQSLAETDAKPAHINIVLNWFDELKRLVPTQ